MLHELCLKISGHEKSRLHSRLLCSLYNNIMNFNSGYLHDGCIICMRAIGFTLAKLLRISNLRNTHLSVNYVHACIMAVSVR